MIISITKIRIGEIFSKISDKSDSGRILNASSKI